jgi:hypothetical protein
MDYEPIPKKDLSYLKNMKCGDIWIDKFGDYILIKAVYKFNTKSKTKPFGLAVEAILLTNITEEAQLHVGELIEDFIPEFIIKKIA